MPGRESTIKVGMRYLMKENGWLTVIAYENSRNVSVKFEDTGYETIVESVMLRRGTVRDYLKPSVYGIGFLGSGIHKAYYENKAYWVYVKWTNMLHRCYCESLHDLKPSYSTCTVEKSWHNFQNFAEWAKKQVGYGNKDWALDKDVLIKGNKEYSEDSCCFIPTQINALHIKREAKRGDYVIGVTRIKESGMFRSNCSLNGVREAGTTFHTEAGAYADYKRTKEMYIKEVANKWRDQIDPRAYQALLNYEVHIDD